MECPDCHDTLCPTCGVCKCATWRTMSTAPKDRKQILIWDGEDIEIYTWNEISGTYDSWFSHWTIYLDDTVAKWMPLPEPPEE